ncbi:MAG: peptidoglycan DD-metalloendopeptidase family protein [Candidatus Magasanikbacteria bacterium]|nr:peptidoglycan DD-metalloendopeptidase family protein [Candidatus Magasanikbacteria bacterium]
MQPKIKFIPLLVGFITLVFVTKPFFVLAEKTPDAKQEIEVLNKEIANRKDKIKQLETTIDTYKKNINEKQTQAVSLKNQISILDNHIAQVATDVTLTQEKIKETELEIEALSITIKEKEAALDKQKRLIGKMVTNIHAEDQKNYIEVALTYDNFSNFYNELKQLENVSSDLGRSVKILRVTKEDLDARRTQVDNKRQSYEKLKQDLETKKEQLGEQQNFKEKLLTDTKLSERRYQTLLASLKQQYQVIDNEVRTFEDRVRKKLEEEDKIKASGNVLMSWPVSSHVINATFHDPDYPFRRVFEHSGIDIKASQGTPVHAVAAGYIGRARRCTSASCYSYILIIHTGNISTVYGHLSNIAVADDAFVNRGDVIGYSGGTPGTVGAGPFVTGQHLHFEVRLNGIPVNPMGYLVQ